MKQRVRTLVFLGLLVALFAAPALVAHASGPTGTWTLTGSMNAGRYFHTATLLFNGKVLVAGGNSSSCNCTLASAELYDPATGMWTPTGSMTVPRANHTATLLPNGKVLVAGGQASGRAGAVVYSSAELYDPGTGLWTPTGSMSIDRQSHTATLLPDGRVLVAGGGDVNTQTLSSAELYDPDTGTWTPTGSMHTTFGRFRHTATLLTNGQVLVAGGQENNPFTNSGQGLSSAELYDPNSIDPLSGLLGTWTFTGSMSNDRINHTATLLTNGQVLVAGGDNDQGRPFTSAELYDPNAGTWTVTGDMNINRDVATATLLPNGQVLVAGGGSFASLSQPNSAELYDPNTGTWTLTGFMSTDREEHTATLLPNGTVLVAGGVSNLSSAELYSTLTNTNPVVSTLPNVTIAEGGTYTASGSFTDAGASRWTATVDYGDGSGVQPLSLSGTSFTLSHPYAEEGSYTLTVTVTDNFGGSGMGTATVTVSNAPFTVSAITAPMTPTPVNTSISASATFTDPGILDTHTAVWSWGDGTTSPGTVTETNGSGSVHASHTYSAAGVYTVGLTVTDDDGVSVAASPFQYVVVYDPTAGFVTGGGWYTSPTGACPATPSASGKLQFGFDVKYQAGATVPTGSTQLTFKAANLSFQSTGYQWLVIAGASAQFNGTGTINGSGNYTFLVTLVDGGSTGPDLIRIKIWDTATGTIIYDSQPGAPDSASPTTAIGGGNLKIH